MNTVDPSDVLNLERQVQPLVVSRGSRWRSSGATLQKVMRHKITAKVEEKQKGILSAPSAATSDKL